MSQARPQYINADTEKQFKWINCFTLYCFIWFLAMACGLFYDTYPSSEPTPGPEEVLRAAHLTSHFLSVYDLLKTAYPTIHSVKEDFKLFMDDAEETTCLLLKNFSATSFPDGPAREIHTQATKTKSLIEFILNKISILQPPFQKAILKARKNFWLFFNPLMNMNENIKEGKVCDALGVFHDSVNGTKETIRDLEDLVGPLAELVVDLQDLVQNVTFLKSELEGLRMRNKGTWKAGVIDKCIEKVEIVLKEEKELFVSLNNSQLLVVAFSEHFKGVVMKMDIIVEGEDLCEGVRFSKEQVDVLTSEGETVKKILLELFYKSKDPLWAMWRYGFSAIKATCII